MRLILAAIAALLMAVPSANAAASVQVGRLACEVEGGIGLIFGSSKDVTCNFYRNGQVVETYHGELNKLGIDIGITEGSHIEWLVFAAKTSAYSGGALAGTYIGVSGEATIGVGLGANVLIGGSRRSFALQPLSAQAQTGLNIAVGLAGLTLR